MDFAHLAGIPVVDGHIHFPHPELKVIFAHFYFLSADLERAAAFLDAHPSVCFDLTPGVEMYFGFGRNVAAAREFFVRNQDRLVFGTDVGALALLADSSEGLDRAESLGRTWVVRHFLESDEAFSAPEGGEPLSEPFRTRS